MAHQTTIKVRGLSKIKFKLSRIAKDTPRKAERALYRLTSKAAEKTRQDMPGWIWDTGNLAGSVDNMVKWEKGKISGYVFTPVEYGIYVHFGTENEDGSVRMRKRPFMNIAMQYLAEHADEEFKRLVD